jgi:hypothetical protein
MKKTSGKKSRDTVPLIGAKRNCPKNFGFTAKNANIP